jgi:hypothetical protein
MSSFEHMVWLKSHLLHHVSEESALASPISPAALVAVCCSSSQHAHILQVLQNSANADTLFCLLPSTDLCFRVQQASKPWLCNACEVGKV